MSFLSGRAFSAVRTSYKPASVSRLSAQPKSFAVTQYSGIKFHSTITVKNSPGQSTPEYHRHSTRYQKTTREMLKALEDIKATHQAPISRGDKVAHKLVKGLRFLSDIYFKRRLIQRACMLETIAAVPGLVSGVVHHMRALRQMRHCMWIKPTMDEAENERMHLMTFMHVMSPTISQRMLILAAQGIFITVYFPFYLLFPKVAHRFVGYLEEEAVHTYSEFLADIDAGMIENTPAPQIAINYWNMPADSTLRDVVLVIRADEADHRNVNHHLSDLTVNYRYNKPCDEFHVDLEPQTPEQVSKHGGQLEHGLLLNYKSKETTSGKEQSTSGKGQSTQTQGHSHSS